MEKYNKYHESLNIDCCDKEINKSKAKNNCCCDGINLPSHNNEIEVLIRQLKREVKELLQTTQAKLLCQDKKIAETMVYIKNNLSNAIRDLLDSMLTSGELEDIITETVLDGIQEMEEYFEELKEYLGNEIKVHFPKRTNNGGDCQIIETKNNVIMIDIGSTGTQTELINYLINNNIDKINYLILTHYHNDHIGGSVETIRALLNDSNIDTSDITFILPHHNLDWTRMIDPNGELADIRLDQTAIEGLVVGTYNYIYPTENYKLNVDDISLQFNNLESGYFDDYYLNTIDCYNNEKDFTNYNNFSMTTLLTHHEHKFLFSGDVEQLAQSKIYRNFKNIDVYKVEHHSLNITTNQDYLNRITPKYSIIQNYRTEANDGTELRATTNKLSLCSTLFSNNASGNIVITSNRYSLYAKCDGATINNNNTYTLTSGMALKIGDDLNDIKESGVYYSKNATVTQGINNTAEDFSGFRLIVEDLTYDKQNFRQTYITSNSNGQNIYTRCTMNGVYGNWVKMTPFSTGIDIEQNTDINTLLSPCSYYSKDNTITQTLQNVPSQINSGFVLINQYINYSAIKQIILPNSQSHVFFIRHIIKQNGVWVYRDWGVYTGEVATTYTSTINE